MDTAVRLLACLVVQALAASKTADNAVGYSRIVVSSPGVRQYTYDIAHDPQGRDFSIHYDPVEPEFDVDNFLPEQQHYPDISPRFLPKTDSPDYPQYIPVTEDYEHVQLNLKHPTHAEMEKSTRAIQNVHEAYSKQPITTGKPLVNYEDDFDLGYMGYGDFMDSDYEPRALPNPYPILSTPEPTYPSSPRPRPVHKYSPKPFIYQQEVKVPLSPTKQYSYPKLHPQQGYVEKLAKPTIPLLFTPVHPSVNLQKSLFAPSFDEGRLQGLADKAYSKVFMAQGYSKPVLRFYPPEHHESRSRDIRKTLFVPVVLMPGNNQIPLDLSHPLKRSPFESQRITKRS